MKIHLLIKYQFYIQEMQIEKQKYQELLEKYQGSTKNQESMVRTK